MALTIEQLIELGKKALSDPQYKDSRDLIPMVLEDLEKMRQGTLEDLSEKTWCELIHRYYKQVGFWEELGKFQEALTVQKRRAFIASKKKKD